MNLFLSMLAISSLSGSSKKQKPEDDKHLSSKPPSEKTSLDPNIPASRNKTTGDAAAVDDPTSTFVTFHHLSIPPRDWEQIHIALI